MMITNILKRASALVVAFFLIACSSQSYEATVASANEAVQTAACETSTLPELLRSVAEAGGEIANTYKGTEAIILVAMHNRFMGYNPPIKGDVFTVARKGPQGAVIVSYKNCVTDAVFGDYATIMEVVEKELKGKSA
jgi:hypothetical protein